MTNRERARLHLRRQGYFVTAQAVDSKTLSTVSTHQRETPRADVPIYASDSNHAGMTSLYLTRASGDLPSPAGTHPWIL